ncbi:hypothetical protein RXV95_03570 [Novosphingobium sp. ZN18A2]|uniref:hypothetical protein n=1 Tax=Novosphingobium sp. ZN18A2 TaxID=3079861 RepID=UPI0030D45EA2
MPHYNLIDLLLTMMVFVVWPVSSFFVGRQFDRAPLDEAGLLRRYWKIIVKGILISSLILVSWYWFSRSYLALGLQIGVLGQLGLVLDVLLVALCAYILLFQEMSPDKLRLLRVSGEVRNCPPSESEN